MERNICSICHVAFDKQIKKCPVCGREVIKENEIAYQNKEGDGRAHGVGGSVCDDCPHCYGSVDWCPFMD